MSFSRLSLTSKVGLGVAAAAAVAGAVWVYRRTTGSAQATGGASRDADDFAFVKAEKADAAARASGAPGDGQSYDDSVRGVWRVRVLVLVAVGMGLTGIKLCRVPCRLPRPRVPVLVPVLVRALGANKRIQHQRVLASKTARCPRRRCSRF